MDILAVTPFERPDAALVRALARAEVTPFLDLGRDRRAGQRALGALRGVACGVRVPEGTTWTAADLGDNVQHVLLPVGADLGAWGARRVLVEVRTVEEALAAVAQGAVGVVGRGAEAGGRVGPENAFVLCQRLAAAGLGVPFWIQGGIGPRTGAACVAGGAAGVVLEAQLALVAESTLPLPVRRAVRAMDGAETVLAAGYRLLSRPDLPIAKARPVDPAVVRAALGADDLHTQYLPAGQDAALAGPLADRFRTAAGVVAGVRREALAALQAGAEGAVLGPDSPLAVEHGTRYPITQGPMTRVSDVPGFAEAVARGGGLPFVALSLLREAQAVALLEETAAACTGMAWGAGILGFAPPEVRGPQLDAIARVKPPFALIAGGRPSQARDLEAQGIPAYLHCPSASLLTSFLSDGARRFVFEGSECGGHVGPRSSFVLWEQQLAVLEAHDAVGDVRVLFAGGLHDARSAAMVSAMAGPIAAKGAKVGVLMGTAYLFTEEAVATGAIRRGFQQAAIAAQRTALVETAPGHATRCVDSPFVVAFEAARSRMEAEGVDPKQMWQDLEALNLGRLRIASKGLVRGEQGLVEVDEATQRDEGMFMIGQVAALRGEVTTIAALHAEVSEGSVEALAPWRSDASDEAADPLAIAIVGMAAVYPDAPDVDTFWKHILAGHDAVREVPRDRFDIDTYYDPDGVPGETTPSKWGGFLPPIRFEPMRYGIPPRSLVSIDPSQLLALEVARRALEDAGLDQRPELRERTSVVFGTESGSDLGSLYTMRAHLPGLVGEVPEALDAILPRLTEDSFPGVLSNVLAGRIANRLDLGGVNYTVDAACASSLAALDLAVKELTDGTSDVVICGGADLHNGVHDYLLFSSTHALSPSGRCRAFDASADGIVLGEGVAAVALRRLEDARRDGDRIYAVLRGVGGSSDGRSLGLTAPRKEGQQRAVARAWARAGVDPAELGLVEAHGTGTVVGDRTELRTLEGSFEGRASDVTLGSVKSQIGHTKCAAGLAGLLKVALAAHHGVRPGMAPVAQPNAGWEKDRSPFHFSSRSRPWIAERRVAAVSAFGFGGTNFHAVLEAADPEPAPPRVRSAELFLLRGEDPAIDRRLDKLAARLDDEVTPPLAALAKAVCAEGDGPVRVAMVASDHASLRAALSAARARTPVGGAVWVRPERVPVGEIALLFPGQGSQRPHMLDELMVAMPSLQAGWRLAPDLAGVVYPSDAFDEETRRAQKAAVTDTRVAQPALGIVDLAAADLLSACGVEASLAGGHSYGELAALCWAGALSREDLVAVSRARADAILAAAPEEDPGTMAAVRGTPSEVQAALGDDDTVVVANHNAPLQTVIAGPTDAVQAALARLEQAGLAARRIPVACAFHSPVVAGAADTFRGVLDGVALHAPEVPVFSNVTAAPHGDDPDGIRDGLARQVASPVRFVDQIEAMVEAGARIFIEAGPGQVLTGLVRKILADRDDVLAISLERSGEPGWAAHLGALAMLAVHGVDVDPTALFAGRGIRDLDLGSPTHTTKGPVWLVDGLRARPIVGDPPPGGIVPLHEPVRLGVVGPAPVEGDREQAVMAFLDNMRAMAEAQRDVMLGLVGGVPSAPRPSRGAVIDARHDDAPPPVASPARALPAPAPPTARRPLLDTLLDVVSARTGYPPEMLDPTLDLEADLSIDSIKRIEILNALGDALGGGATLGDEALEALAGQRTLQGLVEQLEALGLGGGEAGDVPQAAAPAVDLMATLLDVVSARTGYPPEMLDPTLDLEADLSIDSIKRIEILNGLGDALGGSVSLDDEALEALAAERTLAGIVERLGALGLGGGAPTPAPSTPTPTKGSSLKPNVQRYVLVEEPVQDEVVADPIRSVLLVDRDPARAEQLASGLRARGLEVDLAGDAPAPGAEAVLHVDGAGAVAAFPDLKAALEAGSRQVLGFDSGAHGLDGLYKTAAREYPEARVRLVTLDDVSDVDALLDLVPEELGWRGEPVHVRRAGATRTTRVLASAPLPDARGPLPVSKDGVVLLTGGARGITARIALAMAREVPCTYVLVGRSALPEGPEDPDLAEATDEVALRRALASRGGLAPAAIEAEVRRVLKDREIRATMDTLRELGARPVYEALDVRDAAAFSALLQRTYEAFGRIDGVVHGAGVLDDKLMKDKSVDAFARVYETKVHAAEVLADTLRADTRFVVFFGSISGVLGNRGQADYAAANATLDAIAEQLGDRIEGRVVSIDWGPWGGAGMVSDALARAYEARGIGLIPVDEGVKAFLAELRAGDRAVRQVVWQAGDPLSFGGGAHG